MGSWAWASGAIGSSKEMLNPSIYSYGCLPPSIQCLPSSDSSSDDDYSYGCQIPPLYRRPRERYYELECELCQELEKKDPIPEDGDEEKYLFPDETTEEEFGGDEGLKQRFIRYRKSITTTGGFDVECPPICRGSAGAMFPLAHLCDDRWVKKARMCVEFAIETYNKKKKHMELELQEILNTTGYMEIYDFVFYITFKCSVNRHGPRGTENLPSNTYRAVVSCDCNHGSDETDNKKIRIFRNSNDKDLLDPDMLEARRIEGWKSIGKDTVGNPPGKRKFESDEVVEG